MTPRKPYLIRAIYEWILDNDCTPHLLVDATLPGVQVPSDYVQDGRIILNIAPGAVHGLSLTNDAARFSARFGGVAHEVFVPGKAVLAVYARENGEGIMFPPDEDGGPDGPDGPGGDGPLSGEGGDRRPRLKVVK